MKRAATHAQAKAPGLPPAYAHTFEEAGRLLGGISRRQLDRLVARGELEASIVGPRSHRITDESLRAFLARHRMDGGNASGEC